MRVLVTSDAEHVAQVACQVVSGLVRRKPSCVLGLATGRTPIRLYELLAQERRYKGLDFSRVRTFNLDEYWRLETSSPASYRSFMNRRLFDHLNIPMAQTDIPNGMADNPKIECERFEREIHSAGGVDLQILGIGRNGHIGFNEPGSSLASVTRLVPIAPETIRDNCGDFGGEDRSPKLALTMGVGTILRAKQCLVLATGEHKAEAVSRAIEGPVTASLTASALQLHADVLWLLDEPAASRLTRRAHFDAIEAIHRDYAE